MELRINKLISEALSCSRRDAEEYIKMNRVKINGKVARLSDMVSDKDTVLFDQVDLPVEDLIRQSVSDSKQDKFDNQEKGHKKSKKEDRIDSQRLQAAPKSAALRKTSKNNPENKKKVMKMRNHSWDDNDEDDRAYLMRYKDTRKGNNRPKGGNKYRNFDDDDYDY